LWLGIVLGLLDTVVLDTVLDIPAKILLALSLSTFTEDPRSIEG